MMTDYVLTRTGVSAAREAHHVLEPLVGMARVNKLDEVIVPVNALIDLLDNSVYREHGWPGTMGS